jgi:hypothetical protein
VLAHYALELRRQCFQSAPRARIVGIGLELDAAETEFEGTFQHQQLGLDIDAAAPLAAREPGADLDPTVFGVERVEARAADCAAVEAADGDEGCTRVGFAVAVAPQHPLQPALERRRR